MKFIILAAGRGSRVGRVSGDLHKALLPLAGKAIITHQLEAIPEDAEIGIVAGYNAEQIRDYVHLAHPSMKDHITFIHVDDWDAPGGGPGTSLLATQEFVNKDTMAYVSCDTVWENVDHMWNDTMPWVGVSHVPPGSDSLQWCRFGLYYDKVKAMYDKRDAPSHDELDIRAYIGLAYIPAQYVPAFYASIQRAHMHNMIRDTDKMRELRDVSGFMSLIDRDVLYARHVPWTDTGTERSYKDAVQLISGYDWTKIGQATYTLKDENRVIKYSSDKNVIHSRLSRGITISHAVPPVVAATDYMLAYQYVDGVSMYDKIDAIDDKQAYTLIKNLLEWYESSFTAQPDLHDADAVIYAHAYNFYHTKTYKRINSLPDYLCDQANESIKNVDFHALATSAIAVFGHGDFNFGNIIFTDQDIDFPFIGIDWREDFSGAPWIDMQYDLAKLLAGMHIHWGNARRGDFRPWDRGKKLLEPIYEYIENLDFNVQNIETIAALSLINSAPLHASPLDEILVSRAAYWLGQINQ